MRVGIDVGGTFADGVIISSGKLIRRIKLPSDNNLSESIIEVLKGLFRKNLSPIHSLTLSTTLITNLFAADRIDPVASIVVSGCGRVLTELGDHFPIYSVSGDLDFLGKIREDVKESEIDASIEKIKQTGLTKIAVISKYSGRNPIFEIKIRNRIKVKYPDANVLCGHEVWNGLNFPRRIAGTIFTLACREAVHSFFSSLKNTILSLGITCPIHILKADGGTMPLELITQHPLETIFSGPAASAMGCIALQGQNSSGIFMDIGGNTSDIGLIIHGKPLLSQKGVKILNSPLPIHSFSARSISVGGESVLGVKQGQIILTPPEYSHTGAPVGTLRDAARVLGYHDCGSYEESRNQIEPIFLETGIPTEMICRQAVDAFLQMINHAIREMIFEWTHEPAYRIWEIANLSKEPPEDFILLGAAGRLLSGAVKAGVQRNVIVPDNGDIANAIGAAMARPTFSITFRADTSQGEYTIDECNIREKIDNPSHFKLPQAVEITKYWAYKTAQKLGLLDTQIEFSDAYSEQFNRITPNGHVDRIIHVKYEHTGGLLAADGIG